MIRFLLALLRVFLGLVLGLAAFVIRSAVHHPSAALVLFVLLAAVVLFWRRVLGRAAQARHRTRALRWRARLRLRPGPGYASLLELWLRWGRLAALSHGRQTRPGLSFLARLILPATAYAVRLGRAQYGRRVYARQADQTLILAPQRTGKSGLLADRVLAHRGPLLATTTRGDLYQITYLARLAMGPVDVFNPQGVAGIGSTFAWDILEPCRDLMMAHRMAQWLTGGSAAREGHGNLEWFERAGDTALACLLWAAATGGYSIADVFRWNQLAGHEAALDILGKHPGSSPEMFALVRRAFANNRTSDSVRATIEQALAWAAVPMLAAAVSPGRGAGFDLDRFLDRNGTVYLIASGDQDSPLTPLFRAFASWLHYSAGLAGTMTAAGKLDPPLREALDELAVICPVDLPAMLADSAGKGILIDAVAHSTSQLAERWGEHGARTIWALSGVKILLPGISDPDTLEDVSRLAGSVTAGGRDDNSSAQIIPVDLLRQLPDWRAVVLRMNLSPVIVKFRPAWRRHPLRRLARAAAAIRPHRRRRSRALPDIWDLSGLAGPEPMPELDEDLAQAGGDPL